MNEVGNLINQLYVNYKSRIPQAQELERSLLERGDAWIEDHIAFRTFPGEFVGAHVIAAFFQALGYEKRDSYNFAEKKLSAFWLEPPRARGQLHHKVLPKVFISELKLNECSPTAQAIIHKYINDVTSSPLPIIEELAKDIANPAALNILVDLAAQYLTQGITWRRPLLADYETLLEESEYAAWTLLFGSVPNHFTICTHLMRTFGHISELNSYLEKELHIAMNYAGGKIIKGTPEIMLEQSSTLAFPTSVLFQDAIRKVPFAYIEFAHRWPLPGKTADQKWDSYYQGFVSNNADKIFESTYVKK